MASWVNIHLGVQCILLIARIDVVADVVVWRAGTAMTNLMVWKQIYLGFCETLGVH